MPLPITPTRFLLLTGLALAGTSAQAQEKENDLDPVTISASLAPEKISRTGRNILVIKGERFAQLPVNSIDELLRYLPGIEVQARGPMGAQSDIVLRGGTFQQVLIIIDGVRVNDPNTGHFTTYIPISPAEIERIEILKGAASAIYGSEAVGGVINIITKTFSFKNGTKATQIGGQLLGGQYGLKNGQAGAFYSLGKTAIGGGIISNNAKGQLQRGTRGFFHNHTASFSLSHHFNSKLQLSFRSAYDSRKFAAQNFYTTFASDTASERVRTWWNQIQLSYQTAKSITRFSAGYKWLDDRYAFNNIATPNRSQSRLWQALATNEWAAGKTTSLTTGAQFISRNIASNDRGNHNVDQVAGFAVVNQQIGGHLFVSPALRLEWNERSGWQLIPQGNLSYRTDAFQLRASAGKTIRDADFTERFNNYNRPVVTSGRIGNPDLQPERSFSFEAGADLLAIKNVKVSATYFRRDQNNLIDYVTTPYSQMPRQSNLVPTGTYALAKNIVSVLTDGVEADVQVSKKLSGGAQVFAAVGFVYVNSKSSSATPSFYVSSHARYLANFSLLYAAKWFSIGVNGLYKERTPQTSTTAALAKQSKDYFVLNAKAEAFIIPQTFSAFIQADNLFNRNYTDLLGSQMPGRWLMGGIKINVNK